MDESEKYKKRNVFPQMVDKKKGELFTLEKKRENRDVDYMSVEEERVFHNLSTTYQQIVDNVGKDIHGTHRGFYPQFFPGFPQKIP